MNEKFTGKGRYTFPNHAEYSGDFEEDLPEGMGQLELPNGDSYEGQWVAGEMSGFGIYRFYNEKLDRFKGQYEGQFSNSKFNGFGKMIYPNSSVYCGYWRDGLKEGLGEFACINGETIMGRWENDDLVEGIYTFKDGTKYVGHFRNFNFNGFGSLIHPDGSTQQGYWKDNILVEGFSFELDEKVNNILNNQILFVENESRESN